jgi:hypothetical protein
LPLLWVDLGCILFYSEVRARYDRVQNALGHCNQQKLKQQQNHRETHALNYRTTLQEEVDAAIVSDHHALLKSSCCLAAVAAQEEIILLMGKFTLNAARGLSALSHLMGFSSAVLGCGPCNSLFFLTRAPPLFCIFGGVGEKQAGSEE